MRNVSHKRCKENQNTHFMINTLLLKSCRLRDNVEYTVEPDGPQMTIWCMRIIYWIQKSTNTHSEYIILIAFPLQQWLQERVSMLPVMLLYQRV